MATDWSREGLTVARIDTYIEWTRDRFHNAVPFKVPLVVSGLWPASSLLDLAGLLPGLFFAETTTSAANELICVLKCDSTLSYVKIPPCWTMPGLVPGIFLFGRIHPAKGARQQRRQIAAIGAGAGTCGDVNDVMLGSCRIVR
ncbi:MAG: hypothetical protein U1D35_03390 [Paracoccaceae bacterium]|nr:hypothetical protein [Paracoccaceae bacterium]